MRGVNKRNNIKAFICGISFATLTRITITWGANKWKDQTPLLLTDDENQITTGWLKDVSIATDPFSTRFIFNHLLSPQTVQHQFASFALRGKQKRKSKYKQRRGKYKADHGQDNHAHDEQQQGHYDDRNADCSVWEAFVFTIFSFHIELTFVFWGSFKVLFA